MRKLCDNLRYLVGQAQKLVYGNKKIVADGPVFESQVIDGNKIILTFRNKTNDFVPVNELKGFEIAGEDGKYKHAKAKVDNGKVIVWNDEISNPAKLRYAWANNPEDANLRNKSGLPASPFRITE